MPIGRAILQTLTRLSVRVLTAGLMTSTLSVPSAWGKDAHILFRVTDSAQVPALEESLSRKQRWSDFWSPFLFAEPKGNTRVHTYLPNLQTVIVSGSDAVELASLGSKTQGFSFERIYKAPRGVDSRGLHARLATAALPTSERLRPLRLDWGVRKIRAPQAWRKSTSGAGARVLVIDTGIDTAHPAFKDSLIASRNFFVDEGTVAQPDHMTDHLGHGTHVAGLIAGVDRARGFMGVAPKSKVLAARVCGDNEKCTSVALAQALEWGLQQKVDVMVISLSSDDPNDFEASLFQRVLESGVSIVAASGNNGFNQVAFPAALPGVIAVGAVDEKDRRARFSQFGPGLSLVAPGVAIRSAVPMGTGRDAWLQTRENGQVKTRALTVARGSAELKTPLVTELVNASLGRAFDFEDLDVRGKIAVIGPGEIFAELKVANAASAGAAAVVLVHTREEPMILSLSLPTPIPVMGISRTEGEALRRRAGTGGLSSVAWIQVADYAPLNGTSFAAPLAAGVAALVKGLRPSLSAAEVKEILTSTAHKLAKDDIGEFGAGRVDALSAVEETVRRRPISSPKK